MMATIHKFEERGMGHAPYQFLNSQDRGYGNPSGCDYCGAAIRHEYWVRDRDGKTFKLGCDCIQKHGDEGLIDIVKREQRRIKAEATRDAQIAKANAQQDAERERNGGLTDYELEQKQLADAREAQWQECKKVNAWFIAKFFNCTDSSFAESMKDNLTRRPASQLSDRQLSALCDLIARLDGRRGSKAYNATSDEFWAEIDKQKAMQGVA